MFAVLKTGGKQYKVSKDDVITVEKLSAETGDLLQLNTVLMVGDKKTLVGTPTVEGAAVRAEVISQGRGKKVISFVKRRRKHSSKRTKGHRQNITVLRIKEILASGAKKDGTPIETGVSVVGLATEKNKLSSTAESKKTAKKGEQVGATEGSLSESPSSKASTRKVEKKIDPKGTKLVNKNEDDVSNTKPFESVVGKVKANSKQAAASKATKDIEPGEKKSKVVKDSKNVEKKTKAMAKTAKKPVSKSSTTLKKDK
jgi:large subunit ribosomal protein L21